MSIGADWVQTLTTLPNNVNRWSTFMQWWIPHTPVSFPPWDPETFLLDYTTWWMNGVGGQIAYPGGFGPYSYVYYNSSIDGGPHGAFLQEFIAPPYRDEPVLPGQTSVYLRYFTRARTRNWTGRKAFGSIAESDVDGSLLTDAAYANWRTAASKMLLSFTSQGVIYQPVHVSYQLSLARTILSCHPNRKLGAMQRRGRIYSKEPTFTYPIPPPP